MVSGFSSVNYYWTDVHVERNTLEYNYNIVTCYDEMSLIVYIITNVNFNLKERKKSF